MAHLGEELKKLEKELDKIELLQLVETKTKVPKLYLVGGAAALVFLLVLFGVLDSLITNLIGFIYPAYVTLQTIENPTRETSIQWTTYWILFGFFTIPEYFVDQLVESFPIYFAVKLILLLVLFLPQFQGATVVYTRAFAPLLAKGSVGQKATTALQDFTCSLNETVQEGAALAKDTTTKLVDKLKSN